MTRSSAESPSSSSCQCRRDTPHWTTAERAQRVREKKKEAKLAPVVNGLMTALTATNKPRATHIEELSEEVMGAWGGPRKFAREFVAHTRDCERESTKMRGFEATARMVGEASRISDANPSDLSMLSNEELDARILEKIEQVVGTQAQIVDGEFQVLPSQEDSVPDDE